MNVKEILSENGYTEITEKMNDKLLNMDIGTCTNIREIPNDMCKLFEGVEIYNTEETRCITLNFEYFEGEDEFLPLQIILLGNDGYIKNATCYDENLELIHEEEY